VTNTTYNFNTGMWVCRTGFHNGIPVLPGTELAFSAEVLWRRRTLSLEDESNKLRTAIFRQINKNAPHVHHDALDSRMAFVL
jgi:hypothetical protein